MVMISYPMPETDAAYTLIPAGYTDSVSIFRIISCYASAQPETLDMTNVSCTYKLWLFI